MHAAPKKQGAARRIAQRKGRRGTESPLREMSGTAEGGDEGPRRDLGTSAHGSRRRSGSIGEKSGRARRGRGRRQGTRAAEPSWVDGDQGGSAREENDRKKGCVPIKRGTGCPYEGGYSSTPHVPTADQRPRNLQSLGLWDPVGAEEGIQVPSQGHAVLCPTKRQTSMSMHTVCKKSLQTSSKGSLAPQVTRWHPNLPHSHATVPAWMQK